MSSERYHDFNELQVPGPFSINSGSDLAPKQPGTTPESVLHHPAYCSTALSSSQTICGSATCRSQR